MSRPLSQSDATTEKIIFFISSGLYSEIEEREVLRGAGTYCLSSSMGFGAAVGSVRLKPSMSVTNISGV